MSWFTGGDSRNEIQTNSYKCLDIRISVICTHKTMPSNIRREISLMMYNYTDRDRYYIASKWQIEQHSCMYNVLQVQNYKLTANHKAFYYTSLYIVLLLCNIMSALCLSMYSMCFVCVHSTDCECFVQ
jgi:hypothetical protein